METLALAVAVIMLGIMVIGAVAVIIAIVAPKSRVGKVLAVVVGLAAGVAGAWLVSLDVGVGARLIGAAVFLAGIGAIVRQV